MCTLGLTENTGAHIQNGVGHIAKQKTRSQHHQTMILLEPCPHTGFLSTFGKSLNCSQLFDSMKQIGKSNCLQTPFLASLKTTQTACSRYQRKAMGCDFLSFV